MKRIIDYKIKDVIEAKKLFIEAIKMYEAHNKREYIEKNISQNNKYPSVSYFRENYNLSFDECRELAGIKHINSHKKWSYEKIYELLYSLININGFKVVSYSFLKEETGINMNSTIVRFGGIMKFKEELKLKHEELNITSFD